MIFAGARLWWDIRERGWNSPGQRSTAGLEGRANSAGEHAEKEKWRGYNGGSAKDAAEEESSGSQCDAKASGGRESEQLLAGSSLLPRPGENEVTGIVIAALDPNGETGRA